jgi:ribonucleoside-diphosphate reductase alpha chain
MSNQKNIGTIKSSNLCTEIYQYSDPDSYACCVLASVCLPKFVRFNAGVGYIDHPALHAIVRQMVRNLDSCISVNAYSVDECRRNALQTRALAIGPQGLAIVFMMLRIPFLGAVAEQIDMEIAETIYHASVMESCALAQEFGSYPLFPGSPANRGILHFDMWATNQRRMGRILGPEATGLELITPGSGRYDWAAVRAAVKRGMRNSLLVGYMPTVSTSRILGNTESFEPIAGNIYTQDTLAGKFTIVNTHLVDHLSELGLWNTQLKDRIVAAGGSIQGIAEIPPEVREVYRTVREMRQTALMRRTALRQAWVCQGQSLNIYLTDNSNSVLRGVHRLGWKLGLPTGSYYIRTGAATEPMRSNLAAASVAPGGAPLAITPARIATSDDPCGGSCTA